MDDHKLTVFISSSMSELKEERQAIYTILERNQYFEPYAFENDAGARTVTSQEVWDEALQNAGVCIAMFAEKVGEYTLDEIRIVQELHKPLLVYARRGPDGDIHPDVKEYLSSYSDPVHGTLSPGYFASTTELKQVVDRDLGNLISDIFREREKKLAAAVAGGGKELTPSEGGHGLAGNEAKPPAVRRRDPDEANQFGRNDGTLIGRDADRQKVNRLVGRQPLIPVIGPAGVGKKALLRHLVHEETDEDDFPDGIGIHPSTIDGAVPDDILQAVWEEFYEADGNARVSPRKRQAQLKKLRAQIVLPDLAVETDDFGWLRDALPDSSVLVTTRDPSSVGGRHIELESLIEPEHQLRLFEDRYADDVPTAAREPVLHLCRQLDGRPGLIRIVGNHAFNDIDPGDHPDDENHPLAVWAREKAALPQPDLLASLISPSAQAAVDVAHEVGVHVPRDVMTDVTGSADAIDEALILQVLEHGSPRYKINDSVADALEHEPNDALMEEIFASAVRWIGRAQYQQLFSERVFVMRMLEWGVEHRRWAEVLTISRAAEPAMALGGRWGVWEILLEHALTAARNSDPPDTSSEAWALHELGSRALVMEDLEQARGHLHAALQKREAIGETEAAKVTRTNLRMVPMAISGLISVGAALLAVALPFLPEPGGGDPPPPSPVIDIEPELLVADDTDTPIVLSNVGGIDVSFGVPDGVVSVSCAQPLAPNEDCELRLDPDALDLAGAAQASVTFTFDPSETVGDRSITVVQPPAPNSGG